MLKALGWILKLSLLSIAILLAGQWVEWDGRTLSEHVQAQVFRARDSGTLDYLRDKTRELTDDARSGIEKRLSISSDRTRVQSAAPLRASSSATTASHPRSKASREEKLAPSERQKLKALIRELNGPSE